MSRAKRGGRFSYLTSTTEHTQTPPAAAESGQEHTGDSALEPNNSQTTTDSSSGGGEARSHTRQRRSGRHTSSAQELTSVPKSKGRMKQERSQLNVRIPTTLKRQATAKAVLEGRDIGGVVEELLREYLER